MNFRGAKVNITGYVTKKQVYLAWLQLQQLKLRKQTYFNAPGISIKSLPTGDIINVVGPGEPITEFKQSVKEIERKRQSISIGLAFDVIDFDAYSGPDRYQISYETGLYTGEIDICDFVSARLIGEGNVRLGITDSDTAFEVTGRVGNYLYPECLYGENFDNVKWSHYSISGGTMLGTIVNTGYMDNRYIGSSDGGITTATMNASYGSHRSALDDWVDANGANNPDYLNTYVGWAHSGSSPILYYACKPVYGTQENYYLCYPAAASGESNFYYTERFYTGANLDSEFMTFYATGTFEDYFKPDDTTHLKYYVNINGEQTYLLCEEWRDYYSWNWSPTQVKIYRTSLGYVFTIAHMVEQSSFVNAGYFHAIVKHGTGNYSKYTKIITGSEFTDIPYRTFRVLEERI